VAKQDQMSGEPAEPPEGIPPLFKIGAVLLLVLLIAVAVLLTPEVVIPD
jgi:hypothetical protein